MNIIFVLFWAKSTFNSTPSQCTNTLRWT